MVTHTTRTPPPSISIKSICLMENCSVQCFAGFKDGQTNCVNDPKWRQTIEIWGCASVWICVNFVYSTPKR